VAARNRIGDLVQGPARPWATGVGAGLIALAALVAGSEFGRIHASSLDPKLIAWISAAVVLAAGVTATARLSAALAMLFDAQGVPAVVGAVRVISAATGALIVIFSVLAVLEVSIEHLLVGAGLAGVVLGIAAQQSLGNVFAGFVLVFARPFAVGDRIRVRSGALGGVFDASVRAVSLTYVTLETDDGELNVPNSAMLAAGVGHPAPGTAPIAVPGSVAVAARGAPLDGAAPAAPTAEPPESPASAQGRASPPPPPPGHFIP
jgi:small-conductance mechanosensitive channel